jgi:ubiquinone/menaquinone biosynthesis C-methylase UbiE
MGNERICQTVLDVATAYAARMPLRTHLDIGPGTGRLIALFRERLGVQSAACDYTEALIKLPGQKVDIVNLNTERLPYGDHSFDVVTATEVVEHLERYRAVLRDIYRVLKPGGLCILTTPNVLNLNSRLRFLWFGFWNLFGPLPVGNAALQSTGGHITPVSYFYLAHALADAGFASIALTVDRYQRSAIPKLMLLYAPLKAFGALAYRREVARFKTVNAQNAPFVKTMNTLPMLLGRTIVVSAQRPGP